MLGLSPRTPAAAEERIRLGLRLLHRCPGPRRQAMDGREPLATRAPRARQAPRTRICAHEFAREEYALHAAHTQTRENVHADMHMRMLATAIRGSLWQARSEVGANNYEVVRSRNAFADLVYEVSETTALRTRCRRQTHAYAKEHGLQSSGYLVMEMSMQKAFERSFRG